MKRSEHQQRVDRFMALAGQELPDRPKIPLTQVRALRARLIFEEAIELIEELGFDVVFEPDSSVVISEEAKKIGVGSRAIFIDRKEPIKLSKVAKEGADLSVVLTGTFSAFGLSDEIIIEAVDQNNLDKFGPGHSFRADGKLIKPPGFKGPDFNWLDQE